MTCGKISRHDLTRQIDGSDAQKILGTYRDRKPTLTHWVSNVGADAQGRLAEFSADLGHRTFRVVGHYETFVVNHHVEITGQVGSDLSTRNAGRETPTNRAG